jgi:death-on-curing protein
MRLIESAINRAFATFDGKDLYTTLEAKIAAITYGLVNNHGFVDGNKRIGVTAMLLLLRLNEYRLMYNQDELVEFGLGLATGTIDEASIRQWIEHHKV